MAKPRTPGDTIVIKPVQKKKKGVSAFNAFLNKHRALKPYGQLIINAAKNNGIDAMFFAALLWAESKGDRNAQNPSGATGIAQIHLPSHPDVSRAQALNPRFAIQWAGKYLGNLNAKYGNYYDVASAYNSGKPWGQGKGIEETRNYVNEIFGLKPKGYNYGTQSQPSAPVRPKTPLERAGDAVAYSAAKESITHQEFNREWQAINNVFYTYTGKKATRKQASALIAHGFSEFQLARGLSKTKAFYKSPIWQSTAPRFIEVAKSIYGEQVPPGIGMKKLVRQAIINNWDETAFAARVRQGPAYFKSNEFKKGTASLEASYRSIYGAPDERGKLAIQEAALGRWNQDQWEKYLRSQPEYYNSGEFRNKQYQLMAEFGFAPTQQVNPNQPNQGGDLLPDNPRLPGDPNRRRNRYG